MEVNLFLIIFRIFKFCISNFTLALLSLKLIKTFMTSHAFHSEKRSSLPSKEYNVMTINK